MTVAVLSQISFVKVETNGRNGAGGISAAGVKAGDVVVQISKDNRDVNPPGVTFEHYVANDDEIHQYSLDDLSSTPFVLLLIRSL